MKHLKTYLIMITIFLVFSPALSATQWQIDKDHASVTFKIKHIYSMVYGHFTQFNGTFIFSPDDLANSRFDFSIPVKSIHTFNAKRDTHLRSADFFAADAYPEMAFTSTAITFKGDNTYTLTGEMTIKDVTKPVTLDFTFHGPKVSPFEKNELVAGFDTSFEIDRLAYNVGSGKFFEMGIVGRKVFIHISIEAKAEK